MRASPTESALLHLRPTASRRKSPDPKLAASGAPPRSCDRRAPPRATGFPTDRRRCAPSPTLPWRLNRRLPAKGAESQTFWCLRGRDLSPPVLRSLGPGPSNLTSGAVGLSHPVDDFDTDHRRPLRALRRESPVAVLPLLCGGNDVPALLNPTLPPRPVR